MISNQTIIDLDSIRDAVQLIQDSHTFGYDLQMKLEHVSDRVAKLINDMMLKKEIKFTDEINDLLVRVYKKTAFIQDGDDLREILIYTKQALTGVAVSLKDKDAFDSAPEFIQTQYKTPANYRFKI